MDAFVTESVLSDVFLEREAQDRKFGDQSAMPDGIRQKNDHVIHVLAKLTCNSHAAAGIVTWRDVLDEEVHEAYDAQTDAELRLELKQVAAVAVAWIEALDRRMDKAKVPVACDFVDRIEHGETD